MANEFKVRNGLQINETQIVSGITNNSTLIADAYNIPTAGAVKGYTDSISTALSTNISTGDSSLSTAISGEVVTRGNATTSLSTAISNEIISRGSADTSLSTAISGEIVTRGSADTSLSTAVSQRVSVDTSLSTAISGEIVTRGSADTSLSTAISGEIVTRSSANTSLSTALNGKLSISGGTVMSTFYLNGLTSSAVAADVLYYDIATSGITHGAKPTGSGGVTTIYAGNGMTFPDVTSTGYIALGTPSTITSASTNSVSSGTHTHAISGFLSLAGGTMTGGITGTSLNFSSYISSYSPNTLNGYVRGAYPAQSQTTIGGCTYYNPPTGNGSVNSYYTFPSDDYVVLKFRIEGTILRGEGKTGSFTITGTAVKKLTVYSFITTPVVTTDFEAGLNVTSVGVELTSNALNPTLTVPNYNYWTICQGVMYSTILIRSSLGTGQQLI